MNSKVAIAMACNRGIQPKTVTSLLELVAHSKVDFFVIAEEGYTISENRAYCVAQARQNDCTHLLFVDDDMIFPPDTLEKLLAHQKEIVGTLYHSRKLPLTPTVELLEGTEMQKELFKVKAVATGIVLIDLKVFEKIDKPYFDMEHHESGYTTMGEDSWFCRQAERKGIGIWCDPTIHIKHIGNYNY